MKGLRQEDLVNQDLITELRKEFSMTHDDFLMVLTDTDMRVKVSTYLGWDPLTSFSTEYGASLHRQVWMTIRPTVM